MLHETLLGMGPTEVLILVAVAGGPVAAGHVLLRSDLSAPGKLVLLVAVLVVPLAWVAYFLLGPERTRVLSGDA